MEDECRECAPFGASLFRVKIASNWNYAIAWAMDCILMEIRRSTNDSLGYE